MFRRVMALLALGTATAAQAEWREATSKHFIVYSESSEARLRQAITQLEKYDFVLRWALHVDQPSSPQKLKIYLMKNMAAVQDTMGGGGGGVAGYYNASARGPMAVSLRSGTGKEAYDLSWSQVLFHEYAHHLMNQYYSAAYPTWYSEGFADYYGTTKILDKDVVEVGHPSVGRLMTLGGNDWIPLDRLLTAKSYSDVKNVSLLYAQGWLLVHYLMSNEKRAGQLDKYLKAINAGESYEAARDNAFGPGASALDGELRTYARRNRVLTVALPFKPIDVGEISVRALTPSEDAFVEEEIAIGRGILAREASGFAASVRSAAARFPGDAHALSILVQAERAAGNRDAALTAVESWLAAQPDAPRALMHKGELEIEKLVTAKSADEAAWNRARKLIADAHRAASNDPMILDAYYDSFTAQGRMPPAGAQNALYRAFEIVPQDGDIRHKLAHDFEQRDMIPEAIAIIRPAAFELHSGDLDEKEKKKRDEMEEKWREAGEVKRETAVEMLARLEKKLADKGNGAKLQ